MPRCHDVAKLALCFVEINTYTDLYTPFIATVPICLVDQDVAILPKCSKHRSSVAMLVAMHQSLNEGVNESVQDIPSLKRTASENP